MAEEQFQNLMNEKDSILDSKNQLEEDLINMKSALEKEQIISSQLAQEKGNLAEESQNVRFNNKKCDRFKILFSY